MNTNAIDDPGLDEQLIEPIGYDFGLSRRTFVQVLGAGLLIATAAPVLAQQRRERGGRQSRPVPLEARLHIGKDGIVTVMTGKVEAGQGARAEISQAAAEELRVPIEHVQLIMADTSLTPDDGITAGSRTTPSTLPSVRQGCAAARNLLVQVAAQKWNTAADAIDVRDGAAVMGDRKFSYSDLAAQSDAAFKQPAGGDVSLTSVKEWKVLGTPVARPNGREIVTGAHQYPYDVIRPGMLYGKVLRPPTYRAKLTAVNAESVKAMKDVTVVRDGEFVGVVGANTHLVTRAIGELEKSAQWDPTSQPASAQLSDYLREHAQNVPANPFSEQLNSAKKKLRATYTVAYAQHAPMEPRAAVAEWADGKLTVWTGTQNPFGVRRELAGAFHIPEERVRVIVPDFGGGFGGKHTGETAVEAARLAQAAGKPVALRWTRPEEFTFAYFRPAAVIDIEATLDEKGALSSWHFININSGPSGIESPYGGKSQCKFVQSDPLLRHGSYRALASTANNFARESFIDELAHAAGRDPLEFRLAQLDEPRLKAVLEDAAKRFELTKRRSQKKPNTGIGIACGAEKGSFVAACAEVVIDPGKGAISVTRIGQTFECGAITNPANLQSQNQGGIVMAIGPALREAMEFADGKIRNASFWSYEVPRFTDVPQIDVHLLDRPDLPPAGAGETPLICVAPAIANAIFDATATRLRAMPLRLPIQRT